MIPPKNHATTAIAFLRLNRRSRIVRNHHPTDGRTIPPQRYVGPSLLNSSEGGTRMESVPGLTMQPNRSGSPPNGHLTMQRQTANCASHEKGRGRTGFEPEGYHSTQRSAVLPCTCAPYLLKGECRITDHRASPPSFSEPIQYYRTIFSHIRECSYRVVVNPLNSFLVCKPFGVYQPLNH